MPGFDPVSMGLSAAGALGGFVGGIFNSGKANRQLDDILAKDPAYQANPIVKGQLSLARTLLNARMPGATYAQSQIMQNEADARDAAARNATDGSQLLATGGALTGATNRAVLGLSEQEAQDYQRRYGNVVSAEQAQVNEQDKEFQDKVRRLQDETNIRGQQAQNRQQVWNSLTQLGLAGMNLSANGAFGGGGNGNGGGGGYMSYAAGSPSLINTTGYNTGGIPLPAGPSAQLWYPPLTR